MPVDDYIMYFEIKSPDDIITITAEFALKNDA